MEPGFVSRWLFWTIVGFFAIFLLWASLAQIDQTVHGRGEVISGSDLQIVTSLDAGILEEVLVRPGQKIARGSALLRLDPTENEASLGSSAALATSLEMKIARLEAELAGRSPRFGTPISEEAQSQLNIERALYVSRQSNLRSAMEIARSQLRRSTEMVLEAQNQSASIASRATAARSEADLLRPLVEQGIEPRLSLLRAEATATSVEAELSSSRAAIGRAKAEVAEARSNLDRVLRDWRAQVASELAAAQSELASRAATLPALQKRAERTTLRSPVDGSVNRVLVNTPGSAVSSGQPLVEVAPSEGALVIEARIRPQDIASVRVGQRASISVTAFDQSIYGKLQGSVVSVSGDAVQDENTDRRYFIVRLETVRKTSEDQDEEPFEIASGMEAEVFLLGQKRTVLQYILSPLLRFRDSALRD
jgi:adhesin transport system membrane fusion protein